jgi:hypothetical protein
MCNVEGRKEFDNFFSKTYVSLVLDQLFDNIYEFSQTLLDCSVCDLCMFDTFVHGLIN